MEVAQKEQIIRDAIFGPFVNQFTLRLATGKYINENLMGINKAYL